MCIFSSSFYLLLWRIHSISLFIFFFQAEDGIRVLYVTGVQTCALPISRRHRFSRLARTAWCSKSGWISGGRCVGSPARSIRTGTGKAAFGVSQRLPDLVPHRVGRLADPLSPVGSLTFPLTADQEQRRVRMCDRVREDLFPPSAADEILLVPKDAGAPEIVP